MDNDAPLDPHYLDAILQVLVGHKLTEFECGMFKASWAPPAEAKPNESTDVRGFVVSRPVVDKDDGPESDRSPAALRNAHSRAFGAPMPLLNPLPAAKKD